MTSQTLFSFFIKRYKLNFLISIAVLVCGILGLSQLKREADPPVDFTQMTIMTPYPGASPKEIEELITTPIENELKRVKGIKNSTSISKLGSSYIFLDLDRDHPDKQTTIQDIYRAPTQAGLPSDLPVPPRVSHKKASEFPVLLIGVLGDNSFQRNRKVMQLKSRLENLPNVAEVSLRGFSRRELQIKLNPEKMNLLSVSVLNVQDVLKHYSQDISAGVMETPHFYGIKVPLKIRSPKDMETIPIRSNLSSPGILLKDIAEVTDSEEENFNQFTINNETATLLSIKKRENKDSIATVKQITQEVKTFLSHASSRLKIITLFNRSDDIEHRLKIVFNNGYFALILVLVVLALCLPGVIGLASTLTFPIVLFSVFSLMSVFDMSLNTLTLLAIIICLGMLADNSIVLSENYASKREQNLPPLSAMLTSLEELWVPLFAASLTTLLAFAPMLFTRGVMGEFIKWIPIVVSLVLIIGVLESFFLLPGRLCFTLRKSGKKNKKTVFFHHLTFYFEKTLTWVLTYKYRSVFVMLILIAGSLTASVVFNRFILFPKEDVRTYKADLEVDQHLSRADFAKRMVNLDEQAQNIVGKKNIEYTLSHMDHHGSRGSYEIRVPRDRMRFLVPDQVVDQLEALKNSLPFKRLRFRGQAIGPRLGAPFEVVLFSSNEKELSVFVKQLKQRLSTTKGFFNIDDNTEQSLPEYLVIPNSTLLSRLGFNPTRGGTALRTALQGQKITDLILDGEETHMVLKYDEPFNNQMDTLKTIKLMGRESQFVPLKNVFDWQKNEKGTQVIKHYNFKKEIKVVSSVNSEVLTSIQANQKAKVILDHMVSEHPSVSYKLIGEMETVNESMSSLYMAMIFATAGIFFVLLILFDSFFLSFLILSNVLLGLMGVSLAFLLHGKPLSFMAMIGTVGLIGVVINSSIILISFIEQLKKSAKQKTASIPLLVKAGSKRLRPILITNLTSVLGLLPTAYGLGGYDSVLSPVTLALAWGIVGGSLFTLFWTPCWYAILEDLKNRLSRKNTAKT